MANSEHVTATENTQETIDILKRMISDSNYYKMHAQLNVATYYKTLNLDADALKTLIAHYEIQRIKTARPAWLEPETIDMPTPPRRVPEEMRE